MDYQIEYSMNWKANLGNYENVDSHVGIVVNGKEGETPADTLRRARKFVERELEVAVERNKAIIQGTPVPEN